jgi:hypothetical protein
LPDLIEGMLWKTNPCAHRPPQVFDVQWRSETVTATEPS